jgi:hypothetical protein
MIAFTYDAWGRRQMKTVDGFANGCVYDGSSIVQELAGASRDGCLDGRSDKGRPPASK